MTSETTYALAVAHFTRSRRATKELEAWKALPGKRPVVAFAEQLTIRAAYEISPAQVEEACVRTRHALTWPDGRGLSRRTAASVPEIADWYPNFPLVHTLYYAVETFGGPPLWDDLIAFWREDPQAQLMLGLPARRKLNQAISEGADPRAAQEAMWWRLGNAYYSLLRELYVLAVFRDLGVSAEYHVIADALFRADFWSGDTVISLFVVNEQYRSAAGGGRKRHPREILGDFAGFRFADLPRLTRHEYGTVHLPSRDEIAAFAENELLRQS